MIITGFTKFKKHNVWLFTEDIWVSGGMILCILMAFLPSKNAFNHSIEW